LEKALQVIFSFKLKGKMTGDLSSPGSPALLSEGLKFHYKT
jgi:hypothetical protein